jgi:predicted exporter
VAERLSLKSSPPPSRSGTTARWCVAGDAGGIRRWREFWTADRREALRRTLQEAGTALGFRAEAFAPFWRHIEDEPARLTLDTLRGTPLEEALSERVALGEGDNAVSTLLRLKDRSEVQRLREAMPGTMVLDQKNFAEHIASLAKSGLGTFALWTGGVVTLLVLLSMASFELVVAVMLPVAIGVLWTLGAMGWMGLPVDMMNSVFVIFLIGISEDYSVFFVASKLDEWRGRSQHLAATSAAVLISALTTLFGCRPWSLAQHGAVRWARPS